MIKIGETKSLLIEGREVIVERRKHLWATGSYYIAKSVWQYANCRIEHHSMGVFDSITHLRKVCKERKAKHCW